VNRFYQNHLKDQILTLKMVEITVANSKISLRAQHEYCVERNRSHLVFDGKECLKKKNRRSIYNATTRNKYFL
jgi:hypothetical protein